MLLSEVGRGSEPYVSFKVIIVTLLKQRISILVSSHSYFCKSTFIALLLIFPCVVVQSAEETSPLPASDTAQIIKNIPVPGPGQTLLMGGIKQIPTTTKKLQINVFRRNFNNVIAKYQKLPHSQIVQYDPDMKARAIEDTSVTFALSDLEKEQHVFVVGKYKADKSFQADEIAVWKEFPVSFRNQGTAHPAVATLLDKATRRINLLNPRVYEKQLQELVKIGYFADSIGDVNGLALVCFYKAHIYIDRKKLSAAINEYTMAQMRFEDAGNYLGVASMLERKILLEFALKRYGNVLSEGTEALNAIKKATAVKSHQEGLKKGKWNVLYHMMSASMAQKRYAQAQSYAEDSLKVASELKRPDFQARSMVFIANATIGLGNFELGVSYLNSAYHVLASVPEKHSDILRLIYAVAYLPDPELAEKCYQLGMQGASEAEKKEWADIKMQLEQATQRMIEEQDPLTI